MRKTFALLMGFAMLASALALPAGGESGDAPDHAKGWGPTNQGVYYLRNAAYGYALQWWDSSTVYNPHYVDFSGSGGDCANFVSQCLIAGGIALWQGTDGSGYGVYPDTDRPATYSNGTIPFCDYLHQHLTRYQAVDYTYVIEGVNASIPADIAVGDVVIFGDPSPDKWEHAMIVVSVGGGDLGLAGHSSPVWGRSFWTELGYSEFSCASFYHFRVELNETFPFMVNTGSLNVRAGPGPNTLGSNYQDLGDVHLSEMYVAFGTQVDASGNLWYNFWYDERNLWCAAVMASGSVYAKPVNQPQFEIDVNSVLNVRDGPGTSYPIAGQAYDGQRYVPKGMRNNAGTLWRSFWWGGGVGWCSAGYTDNVSSVVKDLTRVNVGFWPSWMGTSYTSLQQDKLTHVAWFSVEMDISGNIIAYNSWPTGWTSLVQRCHENGTKVLLTMTLFGSSSVSTFLGNPAARATGVSNLLAQTIAGNADGIMIDLEYPPSGSDSNLLAFMQELNAAFKAENLLYEVHFCLMPYPWASYGFTQLPAVNAYVDYYFLMGYDYFYAGSATTGPCGALFWPNNIDAWHAISKYLGSPYFVDREKLVYGIPYFGFDYPVATTGHDAPGATRNGTASSRTYSSAMTKLASTGAALRWDSTSCSPWYYYLEAGQWHQVWFDNSSSLMHKYQAVNQLDLPGMGIWALAYDGARTELWDAIYDKQGPFSLDTVPANGSAVSGTVNITSKGWGGLTDLWARVPGGSWEECTYATDIHSAFEADYHLDWDTTSLPTGWYAVEFMMNNSYGHLAFENRSYCVDNGPAYFEVPLNAGWNLVSVPLDMTNTSPASVLESISGQYDSVKWYSTTDAADPWKSYRPGGTVNDLTSIDRAMGFWVRTTGACTLNVTGTAPASTAVTLQAGWNLVGYPSHTERTVSDALAGTGYDRVEGFTAVSPYIAQLSDSYVMKPGEGYWVHVTGDTVWTINR